MLKVACNTTKAIIPGSMLYNALRLSQARIAKKLKIPPETFSPDKLFPRLIEKFIQLTWMSFGGEATMEQIGIKSDSKMRATINQRLCAHRSLSFVSVA